MLRSLQIYTLLGMLLLVAACQAAPDRLEDLTHGPSTYRKIEGYRKYSITQTLDVSNLGPGKPEKQNLWVALIRDFPPYQELITREVSPAGYHLVTDELGNQYAEFDFSGLPAGTSQTVQLKYVVRVNELSYDLSNCTGELPVENTQPELHIESANPQIISLAKELSVGNQNACQRVRSFYDYVAGNLVYSTNERNWGAQAALGPMGADCTEYASLLAALSRSQAIPARYFEGLLYQEEGEKSLSRREHAWLDVYLPAVGWVSLDPTLGRSSITREQYFAHHTPDHIILTLGSSPSTLRGSSYWTHLYWPGDSTRMTVEADDWKITLP